MAATWDTLVRRALEKGFTISFEEKDAFEVVQWLMRQPTGGAYVGRAGRSIEDCKQAVADFCRERWSAQPRNYKQLPPYIFMHLPPIEGQDKSRFFSVRNSRGRTIKKERT